MSQVDINFQVAGLGEMEKAFEHLASEEPFLLAFEKLNTVLKEGFEGTQIEVPVDDGDYRRSAGALREILDVTRQSMQTKSGLVKFDTVRMTMHCLMQGGQGGSA